MVNVIFKIVIIDQCDKNGLFWKDFVTNSSTKVAQNGIFITI